MLLQAVSWADVIGYVSWKSYNWGYANILITTLWAPWRLWLEILEFSNESRMAMAFWNDILIRDWNVWIVTHGSFDSVSPLLSCGGADGFWEPGIQLHRRTSRVTQQQNSARANFPFGLCSHPSHSQLNAVDWSYTLGEEWVGVETKGARIYQLLSCVFLTSKKWVHSEDPTKKPLFSSLAVTTVCS